MSPDQSVYLFGHLNRSTRRRYEVSTKWWRCRWPSTCFAQKVRKIFVFDIELQRSSQILAQGCFNPGECWFPEILNSVGVGELLQSSSAVLSLSQGWKPWAEIGKRLWRSTFCAKPLAITSGAILVRFRLNSALLILGGGIAGWLLY
jgi:hypothetical protein